MLSNLRAVPSEVLDPSLPTEIRQILNCSITKQLHENFCALFAVSPSSRAAQVPWKQTDDGTQLASAADWWGAMRHAKGRDQWHRKLVALEAVGARFLPACSDWDRVLFFVVASLNASWDDTLKEIEITSGLADLFGQLDSPQALALSPYCAPQ
jgi:thioester reductase-like protein